MTSSTGDKSATRWRDEPLIRQIPLAIQVQDHRAAVLGEMAARSRSLSIVDDVTLAEALITDQPAAAIAAARDQQYVMVLDPFSISAIDRGQLESSRFAVPALPRRFQPSIAAVKQALDDGKLGQPGLLRIHAWQPAASATSDLLEGELDLAIWLFGDRPTEIYCCQRAGYLQTHLGFPTGGMALIDIDRAVPEPNAYYSLSLIGSTGAAYADDHHNMQLLFDRRGPSALLTSQSELAVAELIDSFARGIVAGQKFNASWQPIKTVLEVTDQVRKSASVGDAVAGERHD